MTKRIIRLARAIRARHVLGATILLAVGLGIGLTIWRLREVTLQDADRNIENLTVVLATEINRSMLVADVVLRQVLDRAEATASKSPQELERAVQTEGEHQRLRDGLARMVQADSLAIMGVSGRLLVSSATWPTPPISVPERDYFIWLRDHDNQGAFLSLPVQNKTDGQWTFYLARRISGADGQFLGIVVCGIHMIRLQEIFAPLRLPQDSSLTLLRSDGAVLVRHPQTSNYSGETMPKISPWYSLVEQGGGHYRSPGYFEGSPRRVAVRRVPGFPLVVDVSVAENEVLVQWRHDAWLIGGVSGAMLTLVMLLFVAVLRHLHLRAASEQALSIRNGELDRSQQELLARSRELTTTLEFMDQGLIMVDAERRVAVCNRLAMEMLHLPSSLMGSRPHCDAVFAYQGTQEWAVADAPGEAPLEFGGDIEMACAPQSLERVGRSGTVIELRSVPLGDGGFVCTYTDVTSRKDAEQRMRYLAGHDALTGLVNRTAFTQRLAESIGEAAASGRRLGMLYLDLDAFKAVNDSLGHTVGDRLLVLAAQRMSEVVRGSDTVARLGGDEFAIIATALDELEDANRMAERLVRVVGEPYTIEGKMVRVGVSIGVAIYPNDTSDPALLVCHADAALYHAKRAGRNGFRFYGEMVAAD